MNKYQSDWPSTFEWNHHLCFFTSLDSRPWLFGACQS